MPRIGAAETRSVAILGLGARGQVWAARLAAANWAVTAFDSEHGVAEYTCAANISDCVCGARMVVICVPERPPLIQKVIQKVQASVAPRVAVLVESKFELDALRGCSTRPQDIFRAVGAHENLPKAPCAVPVERAGL